MDNHCHLTHPPFAAAEFLWRRTETALRCVLRTSGMTHRTIPPASWDDFRQCFQMLGVAPRRLEEILLRRTHWGMRARDDEIENASRTLAPLPRYCTVTQSFRDADVDLSVLAVSLFESSRGALTQLQIQ